MIPLNNNKVFVNHTYVLYHLLRSYPHNHQLQNKIEEYLFSSKLFFVEVSNKHWDVRYSNKSNKLIWDKRAIILRYLDIMVEDY
jgi:hypothetical protein